MSRQSMPSDRQLLAWLDRNPSRLERHLASFPDEAIRVERLTEAPTLGAQLRETLRPPSDLLERLTVGVRTDESRRDATELIVELLGTAWRTAAVLFTDEETS
jgi:hypothetical protein